MRSPKPRVASNAFNAEPRITWLGRCRLTRGGSNHLAIAGGLGCCAGGALELLGLVLAASRCTGRRLLSQSEGHGSPLLVGCGLWRSATVGRPTHQLDVDAAEPLTGAPPFFRLEPPVRIRTAEHKLITRVAVAEPIPSRGSETQIVLDRIGDARHEFDPADVAAAAERFRELTGNGFCATSPSGVAGKIVRELDRTIEPLQGR